VITLILAILGSASFGLIVKAAHRHGCNLLAVGLINYVVAAAIYGIITIDLPPAESITASLGHAGGLFFATAFFLLTRVLRTRGISISAAILQLTVLFPVTVGIFVWGEQVNWVQMVGILLSLLALPLLSIDPTYPFSLKGAGLRLTCGLLVAGGCCQLTMHSFHYRNGSLHCEEVDLSLLANEHGTPLYVYSAATIRDHYRRLSAALSGLDHHIAYAVKANSNWFGPESATSAVSSLWRL